MRIEKINTEIIKARERIAEWQTRLRDLERQKTEQENLEILQVVRGVAASADEIREALNLIRATKTPPQTEIIPTTNTMKEDISHETE